MHRDELQRHGSSLEFRLRQLKFVSLISTGRTQEALAYSKVLGQFTPKHTKGETSIWCLFGCGLLIPFLSILCSIYCGKGVFTVDSKRG